MSYREQERKRAIKIREPLFGDPGNGIFFVTRLKANAKYRVIDRRVVLKNKGLTSDQTIEFTGLQTAKKCPPQLRRIGYRGAIVKSGVWPSKPHPAIDPILLVLHP